MNASFRPSPKGFTDDGMRLFQPSGGIPHAVEILEKAIIYAE
jgi:hypothetical protein